MPVFTLGDVASSFAAPGNLPKGLGMDGGGCIWNADGQVDEVYKLDQTGAVGASFAAPSLGTAGVAVGGSGCIWLSDTAAEKVYKTDQAGVVGASFSSPTRNPHGLGIDSAGCLWAAGALDDEIVKFDQTGTVGASFASPSSRPRGLGLDADGCVWVADREASAIYRVDQTGTVGASFKTPSNQPQGIEVGNDGFVWSADVGEARIYKHVEESRAIATATKPTAGATPTGIQASNTVSATASPPTATVTVPTATEAGNAVAQATKPATAATGLTAPGDAATDSQATPTSATASPVTPDGYATTPLIDGVPVEDTEQTVRFEDLELEFRVTSAELDTLRPLQSHAGKYEINRRINGSYRVRDTTGGNNTYRYTPRQAETPFVQAQDVVVDSYSEVPIAQGGDEYRVEIVFKFLSPPTPTTGLINESKTATDWLFSTYTGTIATPRVRRAVEAETESGALGYSFSLFCDESQADALRTALGHLGAVGTQGSERADADPVDNSPDKSNSVRIEPRDTDQVARGQYVVRDVEFERLDPDGTWYGVRLEVVPQDEPVVVGDRASVAATPTEAGLSASANIHAGSTPPTVTATATEGVGDGGVTTTATTATVSATEVQAVGDHGQTATASPPTANASATQAEAVTIPDSVKHRFIAANGTDGGDWTSEDGNVTLSALGSPTIVSNDLNGEDVYSYDGTDDGHQDTSFSLTQPDAIIAVYQLPTTGQGGSRGMGDTGSSQHFLDPDDGSSNLGINAGSALSGSSRDTNWNIHTGLFDGMNSETRVDGSSDNTGNAGSNDMDEFDVAYNSNGDSHTELKVAEFWILGAPSDQDILDSEEFLNDKYAVF